MASILKLLNIALLLAGLPGMAEAADIQAGKKIAGTQCRTCHGLDGIAQIPVAPHLAGESEIYLRAQLEAFRSGKRQNEMMSVVAKDLSDEDIANVAAWYSAIRITAEMPD
ncbi:cytochrome C554 [Paramesorhizobium deserti]|uniref:Cytochrome C554 n=1 Tax=Paramesorhizobium deserti TaxID=1494590 RepID=A0A135HV20_9HYPH|nr:cytochrome c [Paramesorhizobium deserti]KXF77030.1 cytochrome C554 [Paramesorhizobium deserti]